MRFLDGFLFLGRFLGVLSTLGGGSASLLVVTTLKGNIRDELGLKSFLKDLIKARVGVRGSRKRV